MIRLSARLSARRSTLVLVALLSAPAPGLAANRAHITAHELARAIDAAPARSVPYRKTKIAPADIRIIRCAGPEEEPTELECTWRRHTDQGWIQHKTWLALDGDVWRVID